MIKKMTKKSVCGDKKIDRCSKLRADYKKIVTAVVGKKAIESNKTPITFIKLKRGQRKPC